jgi:glycosyltransferase involved in cell wall biosynthesis
LKIAINTRFLLPSALEGLGWYTHEIARRLVTNHPEDEFFFIFDRPFDKRYLFDSHVKGIHVPPPARHPLLFHTWYEYTLPFYLNKLKPDIFLSPDNFCSIRYQGKTVLVVHDLVYLHYPEFIQQKHLNYYQKNMPKFLRRADKIVTISEATKRDILLVCPDIEEKVRVIYNGVRDFFKPLDTETKDKILHQYTGGVPYFIYIGAIHPRKNVERLVQAFLRFKRETNLPTKLLLCGRWAWDSEALIRLVKENASAADIIHHPHVDDETLQRLLAASEALLYPSLYEGFGLPILEAFASGTRVITSNISSMPEVAGKAAILIDPYDENQLTIALKRIIFDQDSKSLYINSGFEQVKKFSWDISADKMYTVIDELVNLRDQ